MEGNFRAKIRDDPLTHPTNVGRLIVRTGNDQSRDFQPRRAFLDKPFQRVQNGCEMGQAVVLIEAVSKSLEIHICRVHDAEEFTTRIRIDVARRHRDRLQTSRVAGMSGIDRILGPDDGIVIGERDAVAAQLNSRRSDHLRRRMAAEQMQHLSRLRNFPGLAEFTAEITPGGSER